MAWTTNPYATITQVYQALDLSTAAQTRMGAWIQELLDEAQVEIDRYLGFSFQSDGPGSTRLYDGRDLPSLITDTFTAVTKVEEINNTVTVGMGGVIVLGTPVIVDITADCALGPNNFSAWPGYGWNLKRLTGLAFQAGTQNYRVTGTFGRPSIPNAITRVCIRVVVHWVKMRDTNYADVLAETGSVRQHYTKPLPEDVKEILDQYKPRMFFAAGVNNGFSL